VRNLAVALGFLTRLPVGARPRLTAADLSRASPWFPLVGAIVGAVMAAVHAAAGLVLAAGPATVLALLAAVLVTGGLHEDGLADAADALGAHAGRARRIEILHDPRIGAFGALALGFGLLFAFSVLSGLDDRQFASAAIAGHVLGRWSTLPLSLLPSSGAARAGTLVAAGRTQALAGTAIAAAVTLAIAGPSAGAVTLALAALVTAAGGLLAIRALGGTSGDVFGAVNKLVELAVYAGVAAAA
jgi:adenosylcobinamide-GDP ribazoletransferase